MLAFMLTWMNRYVAQENIDLDWLACRWQVVLSAGAAGQHLSQYVSWLACQITSPANFIRDIELYQDKANKK